MDFKDLLRPIVEEMSGGLGSLFGLSLTDMLKGGVKWWKQRVVSGKLLVG